MTLAARRRKWLAGFLTLLVVIVVLVITMRRDSNIEVPRLDGTTITVVPGIHLLGGLGPAAAYVVETSDGLILIDAGLDSDAASLKEEMAKLKLDWRRLQAIFLTHVHGDHCGGAEHLRAATGAKVYAGQVDARILRAGTPREAFFSTFKMPDHAPHPTTVDVALEGDQTIEFGSIRIRTLDTPGHTPGSTCYLMERAGLRVLFAGDVIVRLGEKPLGTYSTYLAPRYGGNPESYLASLHKLQALAVPDLVLPGHPSTNSPPQSPRVLPERWKAMLKKGAYELRLLIARNAADGANFLDGNPKLLLPDLYYLGDFQGAAVYGFFAASKFFVVDAPGGPGLSNFIKAQLNELGRTPAEPTAILLTACGEKETAGLADLIEHSHPQVVASPAGIETVKGLCPPGTIVVSANDLPELDWFAVRPIALGGRGLAPIAYRLKWGEKVVLFSGRIPTLIDNDSRKDLLSALEHSTQNAHAYASAIQRLGDLRPDLWLPSAPIDGQNANIYGNFWNELLDKNYRAVY